MLVGVSALFLVSACGSSGGSGDTSDFTNLVPDESGGEASDTTTAATTGETSPPETAVPEPADSLVRVSGGTTDSWEIAGYCQWTPDNTGAASSLYVVEDVDDDREEQITILEVWPIDLQEDSETGIIGSIIEPGGNLLTVLDIQPSFDGETITLLADVHDGIKTFDDPPDFTLTVTCGP